MATVLWKLKGSEAHCGPSDHPCMSTLSKASRKTTNFDLARVLDGVEGLALPKAIVTLSEAFAAGSPLSLEPRSASPIERARELTRVASFKAAAISGSFSLPPGPLGLLTAVPELLAIWNLQAQLVADIAAAFGMKPPVKQEEMVYCLFRNMACQVARDVVVRVAERAIIRRASISLLGRALWRFGLPIIGAAGAAAYSWFDTRQVAKRAITLFQAETLLNEKHIALEAKPKKRTPKPRATARKKKTDKVIDFPVEIPAGEGTRKRRGSTNTKKPATARKAVPVRRKRTRELAPAA